MIVPYVGEGWEKVICNSCICCEGSGRVGLPMLETGLVRAGAHMN